MISQASITVENNHLMISGELNFSTVTGLWNASLALLPQQNELHFDFSKVTSSNSAGLALLIEWLKYAKQKNKVINFKNIPPQLLSIAKVSGIEERVSSTNMEHRIIILNI